MPDVHFHDVYAEFQDGSFTGIKNSISGKHATIRTMQSQLNSTRLFNENYFALLAALDDVVARGIKLVALPGDFSDDGQPIHIRGLRRILENYSEQHNLEFFAAPGNHDPVRPYDTPGGEPDFLGTDGHEQRIFSRGAKECVGYNSKWTTLNNGKQLKTICTEEIRHLGYQAIMREMADFGFYPKASYLHWETPYSTTGKYQFEKALSEATHQNRQYPICHQGSGGKYKKSGFTHCARVADASYLVEPVPGLWLLAIDANVYVPKAEASPDNGFDGDAFEGSGNAGYNKMLSHKTHVLDWIRNVVARAEKSGKTLIAFSHFPMTEFYDGQSNAISTLFGKNNFQLERQPRPNVSQVLADTGLKVHVGGHMHFNDTGVVRSGNGNVLFNIQAPSLAAYVPAYKLMTLHSNGQVEVETVVLEKVPRFAELFEHYQQEYQRLQNASSKPLWNSAILQSQSYRAFTSWHIRELTRQRFLPKEWPEDLKHLLFSMNGQELLIWAQLRRMPDASSLNQLNPEQRQDTPVWLEAERQAMRWAKQADINLSSFANWNGFDLAVDFYRLRNAGQLALHDISSERLAQYRLLSNTMVAAYSSAETSQNSQQQVDAPLRDRFSQLLQILQALQLGHPNDHFMLNLTSGEIRELP